MAHEADGGAAPRVPARLRAVIFDLDDTLVESTVDFGKFKRLVVERIVAWGEPMHVYSLNETVVRIIARFEDRMQAAGLPEAELRARVAELDRIMDRVELERVAETRPVDGAKELLMLLRRKGIRIGVLTRGCREYADTALEATGMAGLVDVVESRNSETKPKPHPDAYLRLVRALGVGKDDTIFVGDHAIDAYCAGNAGVAFIGVLTGDVPEKTLREAGSAEVFDGVGQMAEWFGRFPDHLNH
jgi:phosphoglycolate phosphatase